MANVIKYKGQLYKGQFYKCVDSSAPKALKYKGQIFKRVDSADAKLESELRKLKGTHLKHFVIQADIEGPLKGFADGKPYINASVFPNEVLQHGNFYRSEHRSKFPKIGEGHYFIDNNGKIEAWHGNTKTPEALIKEAQDYDKLAEQLLQKEIKHGHNEKKIHDAFIKEFSDELNKRLRSVKGFKRLYRDDFDGRDIDFVCDCEVPNNHDIDDDERNPILKVFSKGVINALHGFAKVKFDLDGYTMGDNGTSNTEPVPFRGKIDNTWYKGALAKAEKLAK